MTGNEEIRKNPLLSRRRVLMAAGAGALAPGLFAANATAATGVSAPDYGISVNIDCTANEVTIDVVPVEDIPSFRSVQVLGTTGIPGSNVWYKTETDSRTYSLPPEPYQGECYLVIFVATGVGRTDDLVCCSATPEPYTINVEGSPSPERGGSGGMGCEWTFSLECPGDLCYEVASVDVSFTGDPPLDSFTLNPGKAEVVKVRPTRAYQVEYTNATNVTLSDAQTQIYCERPDLPER